MKKKTTDEFICDAKRVHGNKYDYSETKYTNARTKVKIYCIECGKTFLQKPNIHLNGCGCPNRKHVKTTKYNTEQFKEKAILVHGEKYGYNKSEYVNSQTKLKIYCNKCNQYFYQRAYIHLSGSGCPECGKMINGRFTKIDTYSKFIEKAEEMHGRKYDYSKVVLPTNNAHGYKINIICPKHGIFSQGFHNHLGGSGCPQCALLNRRNYKNKKTKLYYIAVDGLFKIGLTIYDVKKRYYKELQQGMSINVIKLWVFEDGSQAQEIEQEILYMFRKYRYNGNKILMGGNTELFNEDIIDGILYHFNDRLP